MKRIVEALQDERFPVVYHNCGANVVKAAETLFAQGAAGYHFGNAINLKEMLEKAPKDVLATFRLPRRGRTSRCFFQSREGEAVPV